MEIRLLTYSRLSIPSTTPARGQASIVIRSSLMSQPPMSIQNLRMSDAADGRGTLARRGGCIEPASNLFLGFVFKEHSCSSRRAFPSTGRASKSCFNTPRRATKLRSRTPTASVVGSPMRSSTANLYPKAQYACPYTMTVPAIKYAQSSVNWKARPLLSGLRWGPRHEVGGEEGTMCVCVSLLKLVDDSHQVSGMGHSTKSLRDSPLGRGRGRGRGLICGRG